VGLSKALSSSHTAAKLTLLAFPYDLDSLKAFLNLKVYVEAVQ
jgi:hypothetical protein